MATKKKATKKATKPAKSTKKSTSTKKGKTVTLRVPTRIGAKVKVGNKTYTVVKRVKGLEYQVK